MAVPGSSPINDLIIAILPCCSRTLAEANIIRSVSPPLTLFPASPPPDSHACYAMHNSRDRVPSWRQPWTCKGYLLCSTPASPPSRQVGQGRAGAGNGPCSRSTAYTQTGVTSFSRPA